MLDAVSETNIFLSTIDGSTNRNLRVNTTHACMQFSSPDNHTNRLLLPLDPDLLADMNKFEACSADKIEASTSYNNNVNKINTFQESCTRTTGRKRTNVKLLQVGMKGQQAREMTHAEVMRSAKKNRFAFGRKMSIKSKLHVEAQQKEDPVVSEQDPQDRLSVLLSAAIATF